MLARPTFASAEGPVLITTIVIGVTNHTTALAACKRAFELARPGDQIHLVYAVEGDGAEVGTAERHADGLLQLLQLSSSRPVTVHTVGDEPHRAILDVAERTNADLIVVGNRGLVRRGRFTDQSWFGRRGSSFESTVGSSPGASRVLP